MLRHLSTLLVVGWLYCDHGQASDLRQGSKLLGTAGVVSVEGSAGGGLVPWAFIGSYASDDEMAASVTMASVNVDDFRLNSIGLLLAYRDRFEFSLTKQALRVEPLATTIHQHIAGVKMRLAGDIVYGVIPQLSVGVQYKKNTDAAIASALGADDDEGIDYYLSLSRIWLDAIAGRNLTASLTARYSDANQIGLLGFGGAAGPELSAEASVALFLIRELAVGLEYRQKSDRLSAVREHDWKDVFVAWLPAKSVSVVAAWVDLGSVAGLRQQEGLYLSLHLNTGHLQ